MPPLPMMNQGPIQMRYTAPPTAQAGAVQQNVFNPMARPSVPPQVSQYPNYDAYSGRQTPIPGGMGMEGTYPVYDMPRGGYGYRNPAYEQGYPRPGSLEDRGGYTPMNGARRSYPVGFPGEFQPRRPGQPTWEDAYAAQGGYNADQVRSGLPQDWQDAMATNEPQAVDAQMWARNRPGGDASPLGDRLNQGDGAQLYGGDPAWAELAGLLGHERTQQIYGAGPGRRLAQIGAAASVSPQGQSPTNLQATVGGAAQQQGGSPSWSGWQGGVSAPSQQQLAQAPAQQQQSAGRPWWQNYDLGTLAQLPSEQLQQLPPEVLDAMPNGFYTQHPEFMGRFTGQQMGQRGFAPEFAQNFQGGQPGQNVQPGQWLPSYQNMLQTGLVPQVVQNALQPLQSGGYESQSSQGSTERGEGLSPFLSRPLGGVRPMAQGRYASLDPTAKQALGGTLGYMGNFNQGQDYTAQAGRQGQGGPNVSIERETQAPQQRF